MSAKPRKYKNEPTAVDGIIFDSKREAARYAELKMLLRSKIISDLEWHKPFPLVVNGVNLGSYEADFVYMTKEGRQVVEDVKVEATRTALYKLKAKLMIALYAVRVIEI